MDGRCFPPLRCREVQLGLMPMLGAMNLGTRCNMYATCTSCENTRHKTRSGATAMFAAVTNVAVE